MKEGQQIRLSGQGQSGINGGANGDLYIEIQYKDTDRVHVEGSDVYLTVDVAPWEAALGQGIEVKTPAGPLHVNLPKNAKQGQQLRLKDKGIPNKTPGHLYLILNIVFPPAHSEKKKKPISNWQKPLLHSNLVHLIREQDHDNHSLSRNCI
jgi:curved DNA-binding protein